MSPTDSKPAQPRPRTWRRRGVLVLLGLFLLAACLFHPVENWRGRRAWEETKRELEARGEKLTRKDFIPAAIPDGQNRMAHPFMRQYFGNNAVRLGISHPIHSVLVGPPFLMSELRSLPREIVAPSALPRPVGKPTVIGTNDEDGVVVFKNVPLQDALTALARQAELSFIIDSAGKPPFVDTWGRPTFVTGRWEKLTIEDVLEQVLANHQLEARFDQTNRLFRIGLIKPTLTQVLGGFDPIDTPLQQFDEAVQRPFAEFPHETDLDVPNAWPGYLNQRDLAQSLASRAKIHALLGRRTDTLKDLHRLRALIDIANAGQPQTLVGAMMRTAITRLLADAVQELMEAKLLAPEDWGSVQRDLADIDLLGPLLSGMRADRAAALEWLDRHADDPAFIVSKSSQWSLAATPVPTSANSTFTAQVLAQAQGAIQKITPDRNSGRRFYAGLSPRGWVDQNKALLARLVQRQIEGIDPANRRVDSLRRDHLQKELEADLEGMVTPYNFLVIVIGNYSKASQTCARNQTLVNEAFVACALERFRAANNRYPESLNELVPQFADRLPHDLFDGQPLRFRRERSGYVLYSIGWNAKDDGGRMEPITNARFSYYLQWSETEGDWVWPGVPKPEQP